MEHFFINGGSRAFIARVVPQDAVCAWSQVPFGEGAAVRLTAKNPGLWGNNLRAVASPFSKARTQIYEVLETAAGKCYHLKSGAGFFPGDIVAFTDGSRTDYSRVVKCKDNILTLETELEGDVTDKSLLPEKVIST